LGGDALDGAALKQPLGAPVAGGGADIGLPRQIGIAEATILLEEAQEADIDSIQVHSGRLFHSDACFEADDMPSGHA
jgi:hypothetical protein